MTRPINAAILGFGRWGQLLFEASQATDKLNISAVVTRTLSNAEIFCQEHQLALGNDLNAVLDDPEIDAVIIATPHSQHFEQLMKVGEAGKHVYCEKPFTLSGAEADQALRCFADHGKKVAIGHNRRFAPNTQAVEKLIGKGWFGELLHIDGIFNADLTSSKGRWRDSATESPAGGMTSLGIHVIDMFVNLMGRVNTLRAASRRITQQCDFDDHTTASLQFESGAGGQLTTLTATGLRWQITLYGTKGWAVLDEQDRMVLHPQQGETESFHYSGFAYPAIKTITSALASFADDVSGGEPFPVSPEQISHATEVLEGIIASAALGKNVRFDS